MLTPDAPPRHMAVVPRTRARSSPLTPVSATRPATRVRTNTPLIHGAPNPAAGFSPSSGFPVIRLFADTEVREQQVQEEFEIESLHTTDLPRLPEMLAAPNTATG
jgi:hypothetical protein